MSMIHHSRKIGIIILVICAFPAITLSQNKYWIHFSDKKYSRYNLGHPEAFLSQRSIERRIRQGIAIDSTDLPVSKAYIDSLRQMGYTPQQKSKWLNAVSVEIRHKSSVKALKKKAYIRDITKIQHCIYHSLPQEPAIPQSSNEITPMYQLEMLEGNKLHDAGYQGATMQIAILDGGFYQANTNALLSRLFSNNQILETVDFENNNDLVYEDSDHGMKVLSVLAGYQADSYIGSAPDAQYYLFRTEVDNFERRTEEDNWVAAAEYADQKGVDIINTSLGYSEFDNPNENYTYQDMNGNTTTITKAADMAAHKGILVVVSAGNEGYNNWRYITAPADGDSVLTVGAVDGQKQVAAFSSIGPTSDARTKPDVMALGQGTFVAGIDGMLTQSSGTSFSAPVITGLAACLWEALPELTNWQLINKIRQSASSYESPNNYMGYGIPNFAMAAGLSTNTCQLTSKSIKLYPNPFTKELTISSIPTNTNKITINLHGLNGSCQWLKTFNSKNKKSLTFIPEVKPGMYILSIKGDSFVFRQKIIKQ